MSQLNSFKGPDVAPVKSDGTRLDKSVGIDANPAGYTLANSTTYYYDLGPRTKEAPFQSVHVKWDNAVALTVTIESSNLPDVSLTSGTAGDWIKEDPTNAYVASVGGTPTKATVVVTAGNAGGAIFNLHAIGAGETARKRLKIAVTTGGVVRVAVHGKD